MKKTILNTVTKNLNNTRLGATGQKIVKALSTAGLMLVSLQAAAFKITIPSGGKSQSPEDAVQDLWDKALPFINSILGAVAVLSLLYIGYLFWSGNGDKAKENSKGWVCGTLVIVTCLGIANWIGD